MLAVRGEALRGDSIAEDMFLDKGIVGEILVEGADDVISIAPGFVLVEIEFVAVRFGEAHEIEPVAGPAFPITGRGEKTVDNLLVGARTLIVEELLEFGG